MLLGSDVVEVCPAWAFLRRRIAGGWAAVCPALATAYLQHTLPQVKQAYKAEAPHNSAFCPPLS